MKKCPNCSAVFQDNMLIKCTNCGGDLVEMAPEQPVQNNIPPQNNYTNYNAYNSQFKICPNCGNHCDPRAVICVKCGIQFTDAFNKPKVDDNPSGILKVLCFFIPILGLILYLVNMNEKPISAKAYGKSSLIGFIVGIVAYVLVIVLSIGVFFIDSAITSVPVYPETDFFYSIIHSIF